MTVGKNLYVKTHVARDFLQSADLFKAERTVVWEYVSNSLQYVDPGTAPVVQVIVDAKKKTISVQDNGRGMNWADLQNFFVMHGENLDRASGRAGRGRFGTGKSAAFGIANVLRIITVRDGLRSTLELRRSDIKKMKSGDPIPVTVREREITVDSPNGTIIEIEEIQVRSINQANITAFIERHLAKWPKGATVYVNGHQCEYREPPVAFEERFRPSEDSRGVLGDVELIVKVAKTPLNEEERGISVFANGVWYTTTLAGGERREMAQYIFGEIDVPTLDDDAAPIAAFDQSRSMQLNANNPVARTLLAFIGVHTDEVRHRLAQEEKRRQDEASSRKLAQRAAEIARVINEDFSDFRARLARARVASKGTVDLIDVDTWKGDDGEGLAFGDTLPATIVSETGAPGKVKQGNGSSSGEADLMPQVEAGAPDADRVGRPADSSEKRSRRAGGFGVRFEHMGADTHRAKYVRDERVIYINLDHPQLAAAGHSNDADDPIFLRLAYEIALSEYSIALASEMDAQGSFLEPSDAIVEIREALDRVARRAASLYE